MDVIEKAQNTVANWRESNADWVSKDPVTVHGMPYFNSHGRLGKEVDESYIPFINKRFIDSMDIYGCELNEDHPYVKALKEGADVDRQRRGEKIIKGDYDGHPFRGNAYVDEFYNPRPSIGVEIKNPLKRKTYTKEEIDELYEKAENGNKKARKILDKLEPRDRKAEVKGKKKESKKDKVEKAKKSKSYDPDFEGNQWVDEHGNPRPNAPLGGGKTRKERKQYRRDLYDQIRVSQGKNPAKRRAATALSRASKALAGSGLKLALDTDGKPVIVASNRRTGVGEWKRDKWGRRYLRCKPPEFMFHTKPSNLEGYKQTESRARRDARRGTREYRDEASKPDTKPVKKVQKDAKENIAKAYRTIGKVIVYKQEVPRFGDKQSDAFYGHEHYRSHPYSGKKKLDHRFYGNQYIEHPDSKAAKRYAIGAGAVGAVAGGYRVLNDKKIVDRRRDLFATTLGGLDGTEQVRSYSKLNEIKAMPSGVPKSNLHSVVDDIRDRRLKGSLHAGTPLKPLLTYGLDGKKNIPVPRTKMEARWLQLLYGEGSQDKFKHRNNRLLARSMDTELTYLNQRVKRIPDYLKRSIRRALRLK